MAAFEMCANNVKRTFTRRFASDVFIIIYVSRLGREELCLFAPVAARNALKYYLIDKGPFTPLFLDF